jgi:hypothetical protein
MGSVVDAVALGQVFFKYFSFCLSVWFHQCSILIFRLSFISVFNSWQCFQLNASVSLFWWKVCKKNQGISLWTFFQSRLNRFMKFVTSMHISCCYQYIPEGITIHCLLFFGFGVSAMSSVNSPHTHTHTHRVQKPQNQKIILISWWKSKIRTNPLFCKLLSTLVGRILFYILISKFVTGRSVLFVSREELLKTFYISFSYSV